MDRVHSAAHAQCVARALYDTGQPILVGHYRVHRCGAGADDAPDASPATLGKKDARAFTSFLAGRAEDKAKRVESAEDKVKAANQRWRQGEGSNVIKTIKQEVKAATGKRPTTAQVSQLVSKAKVGKNLGVADVKKVVRAAKKAKSFKRGGGKGKKK